MMPPETDDDHSGKFTLTRLTDTMRRSTALLLILAFAACAPQKPQGVLNSDLIRSKFGSYGVEVLYASTGQRLASLYSEEQGQKTTRTFAVVNFTLPKPQELTALHARIVAGESIGEVFRSANWTIEKHHVFIGELNVGLSLSGIGKMMHIQLPKRLASHQYYFVVAKDGQQWKYATITEVHHPGYLDVEDLRQLYGEIVPDKSGRTSLQDFVTLPAGI